MDQSIASSRMDVRSDERLNVGLDWESTVTRLKRFLGWLWSVVVRIRYSMPVTIPFKNRSMIAYVTDGPDVDRISTLLSVEARGRADGRNESPAAGEEVVSGTQREIVAYFKDLQRRAQHRIHIIGNRLRRARDEVDFPEAFGNLRDIPAQCESKILRLNAEFQPKLSLLGERMTLQKRAYDVFREKHRLSRAARDVGPPVAYHALMAFMIAAGALVLGNLSAAETTPAQRIPALWAIGISLVVTLVSFLTGAGIFRSVNHARRFRRFVGWLGSTVTLASIGALAFFVAHYFSVLGATPNAAPLTVVSSIMTDPLGLGSDVAIWTGAGVVVLLGLFAFLIGYKSDDPYPGYGAVQRAFYQARNEHDAMARRLRRRVNGMIDEATADVDAVTKRVKARLREYSSLVDESKRIPALLSDYHVALEDTCNIVLDRYRIANSGVRQSDVPKSFSEHVCFRPEHDAALAPHFSEADPRVEELDRSMTELEDEAVKIRQRLKELNWHGIGAYADAYGDSSSAGDVREEEI